jgi:flagellar basal-body rod protein FlgB
MQDLVSSGAMPVLEKSLRFAAARQRILVHNIANAETPNFRPMEVSTRSFQEELGRAIDAKRKGRTDEPLEFRETSEVRFLDDGSIELTPQTPSGNVLYHDRNNRDMERMMQDLAENNLAYRTAVEFIRRENDTLRIAITQRP